MLSVVVTIIKFAQSYDIINVVAFTSKIHVTEMLQTC